MRPRWRHRRPAADEAVGQRSQDRADERRDPEQPELLDRPALAAEQGDDGRARRAGRVHRGPGDRDRGEVDHRQGEADGDGGEALRRAPIGDAEDHQHEDRREDDLGHQARTEVEQGGRVIAVAVRSEPTGGEGVLGLAPLVDGDEPQDAGRGDGRDGLGDDVGDGVLPREALGRRQPDGHRRVEVPARDVAERVHAAEHRETEGQRDAHEPDAGREHGWCLAAGGHRRCEQLRGEHGTAAPAEDENEGSEELRAEPAHCRLIHLPGPFRSPRGCRGGVSRHLMVPSTIPTAPGCARLLPGLRTTGLDDGFSRHDRRGERDPMVLRPRRPDPCPRALQDLVGPLGQQADRLTYDVLRDGRGAPPSHEPARPRRAPGDT